MLVLTLTGRAFKRVRLSPPPTVNGSSDLATRFAAAPSQPLNELDKNVRPAACLACDTEHLVGHCPLKHAGVESCPLCGIAHYGHFRTCPHLSSLTQCRRMLEALKQSPEPAAEKKVAKQYVVGIIGDLTRRRRLEEKKGQQEAGVQSANTFPSTFRAGVSGQSPTTSLMHQAVNGGTQGLPNQQTASMHSTHSLPQAHQLVNGNGHINGFVSNTAGGEVQPANGSGRAFSNNGRTGGSSS